MKSMNYQISVHCLLCSKGGVTAKKCKGHANECRKDQCLHHFTEDELVKRTTPPRCKFAPDRRKTTVPWEEYTPWFEALGNIVHRKKTQKTVSDPNILEYFFTSFKAVGHCIKTCYILYTIYYSWPGEPSLSCNVTEMIFSGFQYRFANFLNDTSRRQNIVRNVK